MNTIRVISVMLCLALLVGLTPVCAQEPELRSLPDQEQHRAELVLVASRGDREVVWPFVQAIRAQLSDLPIRFRVQWVDIEEPVAEFGLLDAEAVRLVAEYRAEFVFLFSVGKAIEVTFYSPAEEGVARDTRVLQAVRGAGRTEALALVVRASVSAYLLTLEEPESEPPLHVENETPDSPQGDAQVSEKVDARLSITIAYALSAVFVDTGLQQGIGLGVDLAFWSGWRLGVRGFYVTQARRVDEEVELLVRTYPLWVALGYGTRLGRVEIAGELAFCVELGQEEVRVAYPSQERKNGPSVALGNALLLRVRAEMMPRVFLDVGLGGQLIWRQPRYVADAGEGEEVLFEPWPVRPLAQIGVTAVLF